MYQLNNFCYQTFLSQYWQKKPGVFRQVFDDFVDPLDEHELAGLGQEEGIDARVISCHKDQWQLSDGPFEDYAEVCQGDWTLLVQRVDHFVPEADDLINTFNFIPNWRIDDLMVSFSVNGAGVGPHTDQYDVFIVQGKGTRRWQIGLPGEFKQVRPHPKLAQIEDFVPIIDEVLQPGDMIYIPPGHPHNGQALSQCMNYSIGMRAPDQQALLNGFADYVMDQGRDFKRYQDPDLTTRADSAEIKLQEIHILRGLLHQLIDSEHFERWLPQYMSDNSYDDSDNFAEQQSYTVNEVAEAIGQGRILIRQPGVRPVFVEHPAKLTANFSFSIHGQSFDIEGKYQDRVKIFLSQPQWQGKMEENYQASSPFVQLLTILINSGFWIPK